MAHVLNLISCEHCSSSVVRDSFLPAFLLLPCHLVHYVSIIYSLASTPTVLLSFAPFFCSSFLRLHMCESSRIYFSSNFCTIAFTTQDDHNKGARGRGGRAQGSRPGRGDERGATPRTSGSSHPNKGLNGTASQHDKGQGRRVGKTVVSSLFTGGDEGPLGEPAPRAGSGGPPHVRRTRNPAVFSGTHFRDLDLTDRLVRQLEERIGVTKLTPAQQLAAPFLMVGRDVLLKSPTGTGKTLAYAVPIVQDLQGLQHRVRGRGERTESKDGTTPRQDQTRGHQ